MQLKQGTTIANRYVVSEILGKGGMAIVYKARDIKLDRDVTLKIMREEFVTDDDFINRFNVEAKAAAKLTHQNIVNVYDVGKFGDIYFIVMEYIEGVTLKDIIRKKGAFTNEEILGVSIQIAQALEVAHRNNIVHRDIKPQNILINSKGDVKVTDFGIARAINANTMTNNNNTMGSVHYFSPEQARGGYIDQKSDVYSLGITMFEMATGEIPFDDESVVAIALKHISEPLPNINEKNSDISESVVKIIEKATQKVGSLRFDTIEQMNNELKRALINSNRNEEHDKDKEEIKTFISPDVSHTLLITEDDITEIRTKAMTAFFDEGDLEEINMLSMNQDDDKKKKRPKIDNFDNIEEEEQEGGKKVIIIGVLCAILLSFIVAIGVFKYVGGGNELIDVPNFIGMDIEEAKEEAKQYRITIDEDSKRYDENYEEGVIVDQDYVSGQDQIRVGGTITVITSLGAEKQTVPNVVGDDVETAFAKLDECDFKIEYKYEYYDDVDLNTVQKQTPEAGSEGESGDTVTIYISKGEETSTTFVPDLIGKSESKAKTAISDNELTYGTTTYDYNDEYAKGVVFAQTPKKSAEVSKNSVVNLFVSNGPKPKEVQTEPEKDDTTNTTTSTNTDKTTSNTNTTTTTPEPPKTSTKTVTVNPIDGAQPTDKVSVKVVKIGDDGNASVAYENTVTAGDLPLSVSIEGSGSQRIQLSAKVNDGAYKLLADTNVNFGE